MISHFFNSILSMKDDSRLTLVVLFGILTILSFSSTGIGMGAAGSNIYSDVGSSFLQTAFAHIFTPNDYASFVSSADQLLVESKLVQENFANNNIFLAQSHANNSRDILYGPMLMEIYERNREIADELTSSVDSLQNLSSNPAQQQVNQLVSNIDTNVDEIISSVINEQQKQGSNFMDQAIGFVKGIFGIEAEQQKQIGTSLQPLRLAELIDDVLLAYGRAYNVSFDMTDMTNMVMADNSSGNNSSVASIGVDQSSNNNDGDAIHMEHQMGSHNYSLVNVADYQSAQALAAKSLEIFNNELKPMTTNNESITFVTNLENGLIQLHDSIRNKAPPMNIMIIVHVQIHPNILGAFNLDLDL